MNEITTIPFGKAEKTFLDLPDGLTELEWKQLGHKLCGCRESLMFWIGDWINYGVKNFGEKYKLAKEIFGDETTGGYHESTLRQAASVAGRVSFAVRTASLSFNHHQCVARLGEADQKKWLALAVENDWSVSELNSEIRKKDRDKTTTETNPDAGIFYLENWFREGQSGLKQLFERKPLVKWHDDDLISTLNDIGKIEQPLLQEAERRGLKV